MPIHFPSFASVAGIVLVAGSVAAHTMHQDDPPGPRSTTQPASFDRTMEEAMNRMDRGMSVTHTGDPDRDFAAMMIPHHQGAIDMAKAELQYGRNPVLRRLAEGIIVEQQQEIVLMRRELQRAASPQPGSR